jgi:putative endonuclease
MVTLKQVQGDKKGNIPNLFWARMAEERQYYVYILTNQSDNVLYIGVTSNLERRIFQHKNKLIEGFTQRYNLSKRIYYEVTSDIQGALEREKQLKHWQREWKINLINNSNLKWRDLSEDF